MARDTLLITGGTGYLGRHLLEAAARRQPELNLHYTGRASTCPLESSTGNYVSLEITRDQDVLRCVRDLSPKAVIHCAAQNPGIDDARMLEVNALGTRNVARAAHDAGARMVHVSTDVVHRGDKAPYDDAAAPAPIIAYGHSKAAAEQEVTRACPGAVIVRTSLIYGLTEIDRGTASFVEKLQRGEQLALFRDVIRQPVWIETLCAALLVLALDKPHVLGCLNVAGAEALSREQFGRAMLGFWNIDTGGRLSSGLASELASPPPLDLRLHIAKAQSLLGMRFPGVNEVLSDRK